MPVLGLYINFFSKVLYILYCSLLENFKYSLLACYISKLFIPPNSTDRFLTAPVRTIKNSRRHLYLVSYQEPIRSLYVTQTIRNFRNFRTSRTSRTIRTISIIRTISTIRIIRIIKIKFKI
jgi:hypothetical protein